MIETATPPRDKVWYLKKINLFSALPQADIMELAAITEMHHLDARRTVFTPGEEAGTVYLLKAGRVKLSLLSPGGKELTLAFLEPGEVFGEITQDGDESHATVAEAVEPSIICTLSRESFERFLSTRPSLSLDIAKFIGFRLRKIHMRLQDLLFLDVRSRIMKILRDLADEYGVVTPRGIVLKLRLTHQDIANLIGATRETTSATISDLRNAGLIDQEGKFFLLPAANR